MDLTGVRTNSRCVLGADTTLVRCFLTPTMQKSMKQTVILSTDRHPPRVKQEAGGERGGARLEQRANSRDMSDHEAFN